MTGRMLDSGSGLRVSRALAWTVLLVLRMIERGAEKHAVAIALLGGMLSGARSIGYCVREWRDLRSYEIDSCSCQIGASPTRGCC